MQSHEFVSGVTVIEADGYLQGYADLQMEMYVVPFAVFKDGVFLKQDTLYLLPSLTKAQRRDRIAERVNSLSFKAEMDSESSG